MLSMKIQNKSDNKKTYWIKITTLSCVALLTVSSALAESPRKLSLVSEGTLDANWDYPVLERENMAKIKDDGNGIFLFGNGKHLSVVSKASFTLPSSEDKEGQLAVVFQLGRAARSGIPSRKNPTLIDSSVGLKVPDGKVIIGFMMPPGKEATDTPMLSYGFGGEYAKQSSFATPTVESDDVWFRISINGNQARARIELAYSKDGQSWEDLDSMEKPISGALRISMASSWGDLLVKSVNVSLSDDVSMESSN